MNDKRPLMIALDFQEQKQVEQFLTYFPNEKLYVKVGMELFYAEGLNIIHYLKEQGHNIFLDLKLHDIPNTVKQGMKSLARLGVDLVNVHAAGGRKMMEGAIEGLEAGTEAGSKRPLCIAVTQLTSTSEAVMQNELLIPEKLDDVVIKYARLAHESGLDGVVCSTHEVERIGREVSPSFITVTPGIRMKDDAANDQTRIATPDLARCLGSTAIVVGRSITAQADPYEAYIRVKSSWEGIQ
ncbi:orotidine-5'-phosphate decarboxylase [Metabacillus fastidiosus]|uniref:Orotidine 5'-phosphate decarboxylase n=1 Tax=Metabacillus fastidiosus TaxID=1458 RepID=A0ABU6NX13_9BACI|nr:orotidine-5'-phosphate decarboxylase [Metabacillus fastidiosus]MED4401639.1 orotidine-5'-phosphate decarboxylase [Metabacillus fastidiosus]